MPNWKKVIVSGSDATLSGLTVTNNVNIGNTLTAANSGFTVETSSADLSELFIEGNITASGLISASGLLFASLSYDSAQLTNKVVVYDSVGGRFYYTGSYGGAGGSGDPTLGGADTDWFEASTYLTSSKSVTITGSSDQTALIVKSNQPINSQTFTIIGSSSFQDDGHELFSISDRTSGSIFSVNDISGLPVIEVLSDGTINVDGNIEFTGYNKNGITLVSSDTDLTNFTAEGEAKGEIVKFGSLAGGSTMTAGDLIYWDGLEWNGATQQNAASGSFLGVLLGTDPKIEGVLTRGIVKINSNLSDTGLQVYIGASEGTFTTTAPSAVGRVMRAVGHYINPTIIYFNPSTDFLKL